VGVDGAVISLQQIEKSGVLAKRLVWPLLLRIIRVATPNIVIRCSPLLLCDIDRSRCYSRNYSRDYSLRIGQQLAAVVTATGMESSSTRGSQCASDDLPLRSVGPVDDLQVCQRAMQNVNAARLFTSP